MKSIGVVTAGRSDYGIYLPVLRGIAAHPRLDLRIYATGMHLAPGHGYTVEAIEADGFAIYERVETLLASNTPVAVAKSIGVGVAGFAQVFSRGRPDMLVVLGDRFEMYAAALAALPFAIPVAHIHGGELSQGAIDDALRHSLTKLSHLHFAATDAYARRIEQLGEEPGRVVVSGAPSLDNLRTVALLDRDQLADKLGIALPEPPLLVTLHPVTLEYERTQWHVDELLAALAGVDMPIVFTAPNADTGGDLIAAGIDEFVREVEAAFLVENLGLQGYFSMMAAARAMVGNSSSGIIEAASFALPVLNIGARQRGRDRGRNVVDAGHGRGEIAAGIEQVCDPAFAAGLAGMANPYGSGDAAETIVERLAGAPAPAELLAKEFNDWERG